MATVRLINSASTLKTYDGKADLYVRRYDPIRDENGGTLVIIHGAGEHAGRYGHFIERVVAAGWTVLAADLRGHGRSGGIPMHLETFEEYLDDLDLIWRRFQLEPQSTAIFAHSMGGLVAVRYAQTRLERMKAVILSAPLLALRIRVRLFKRAFGKVCSMVAPTTRFQTIVKSSDITRNPIARAHRARDPLMRKSVTAGWYYSVRRALLESLREAQRFTLPLLILQGNDDQIVDPDWPAQWVKRINSDDCTVRMLTNHCHEVIQEPEWEQSVSEMLDWLHVRFSTTSPAVQADLLPFPVVATGRPAVIRAPRPLHEDRRAA